MAHFDLSPDKLRTYRAPRHEPADFDRFWKQTLADARKHDLDASLVRVDEPIYELVDAYDVTYRGYGGQPVRAWFIEPAGNTKPLPTFVSFIGYGGGRSFPLDYVSPVVAGFANLVMDTRGQGSNWMPGDTPDDATAGPHFPGFMTRGIESRERYYYRRVFTDAARAVDLAASLPHVDAKRIAVAGGSQGGGIAIAAAGLSGRKVKLCLPDVPFLCHYRRACTLINTSPYSEIAGYLKCHRGRSEDVFGVLDYFDGVNLARRITARCLFSVGLMDDICPPSTVYAAYNNVKAPKAINIYDFNYHEGGGPFQSTAKLAFAKKHL
ncbi:MAG: Cephalosporin-C deacetylase [Phycisphaerae bacterium]|nr:Cephalosporin-C deacetylase [Phycisphaerae bacterium]